MVGKYDKTTDQFASYSIVMKEYPIETCKICVLCT
jgi:hypothetical protein